MASTNQDEVHAADLRSKVSAYDAKTPADGPQQLDFAHIIRVANSEIKDKHGTPQWVTRKPTNAAAYYKVALEEAQAKLDAYSGDHNGRHDLSKQVQHLWNACAGEGGNWADLSHVKAKRRQQQKLDLLHNLRCAWQLTDGNAAQAADLLMADVAGRDLFKRAQYEAARRRVQL